MDYRRFGVGALLTASVLLIAAFATPLSAMALQSGLSSEEEEYLGHLTEQLVLLAESMDAYSGLMESPQIEDVGWQILLAVEFAAWRLALDDLRAVNVPSTLEELHASYALFVIYLNAAADHMTRGIDSRDIDLFNYGVSEFQIAASLMTETNRLLSEMAATRA